MNEQRTGARIVTVGGGPAGLYFSILMKKAFPEVEIQVMERNRPQDTFGWGVVFSDETLGNFERADPESYAAITARFKYWQNIETYFRGTCTTSTGHGFCALARRELLGILQDRCRELGVELAFETEVESLQALAESSGADLILGADGANSLVRRQLEDHFKPSLDHRRCRYTWLGTTKPLDAFTFIFLQTEHGVFQVHAYPFQQDLATWIVECREETWTKAGLDRATEEETVAFCEELFADSLDGHPLLTNRSLWRTFGTVRCETWHRLPESAESDLPPILLLGDAAHTAHFSIGSGTKMAMEDAILLVDAFRHQAAGSSLDESRQGIAEALVRYQDERWVDVLKLQKAAQTSLEWFERSERYMDQHPLRFTFNLLTRSKRITYDNLTARDPALVAQVAERFRVEENAPRASDGSTPVPIFAPFRLRELELPNRIVVSPMCQYSATEGLVDDWHLVHLGSRGLGGAGLVVTEMTDVTAEGRITHGCAGLYTPEHRDAWKRIVGFVHARSSAKIGIQLAHAGRKGSTHHPWQGNDVPLTPGEGGWQTLGPSAIPFKPDWPVPKAMDRSDMDRVTAAFVQATHWSEEAGFDLVELHMAHGYLLSSFLSPLTNGREDAYGGSLENRLRYPLEVLAAVREAWPDAKPISVRISASDWMPDGSGMTAQESVEICRRLHQAGCDVIDVSSGGNVPESEILWGRMYQVPFAEEIRYEAGVPVICVGALLGADHANTVLAAGRADLCAMARPHLREPYLTLDAASRYSYRDQPWPGQYVLGRPKLPDLDSTERPPPRKEPS